MELDYANTSPASRGATSSQVPKEDRRDLFIKEASCESSTVPFRSAPPTTYRPANSLGVLSCLGHATMVCAGWSDSSSGPLIPYIQVCLSESCVEGNAGLSSAADCSHLRRATSSLLARQAYFGVSYTVVSMLFIGQMVGFLTAGFSNSYWTEKYGLGKVIAVGSIIQLFGFVFLIPAFAFPVMPVCYVLLGFGMALQDAQANTYIATLPNVEFKMGLLHASYGFGALICPLAATAFASSGIRFSYFYSVSIGVASLNAAILLYAFKFSYRIPKVQPAPLTTTPPNEWEAENGAIELESISRNGLPGADRNDLTDSKERGEDGTGTPSSANGQRSFQYPPGPSLEGGVLPPGKDKGILRQTLENRTVWICCLFILVYVGAEVSMGGWIVTFLIDNRNGGPSAGYVATGFWGGLTLGRAVTSPFNVWFGEKRVIWLYLFIATGLEFAIWFSRDFVGNAVTVALVGFLLGPIYPITMSICTKVLPRSLHASGIGFIAAAGQAGSAIFPFLTGALAQRFSPAALQPVLITLFVVQALIWIFCPSPDRKKE
ncbi:BZ3500_MvSof-1268-A1-R1_Chr11-3g03605 [Microbotryum saponariae]|uniref:BZ3500_MvSof-1268-A1-R1_Chr11-3g03605 protein n=1 Tax=Microbotryum saponariae TaxID=289078 RepID=A0A2X0L9U2_9BASI|nr:BZ3500_MvSof-1268-A1-R1_Chr11-3g03605 [Microbotryum saponariae]SDA03614.1 BZ3501_MvSof-1269-A2-R1_Chr11g03182 [Microbotryum saponariae]